MSGDSEVSYTLQELSDYLPAGWTLADPSDPGAWNTKRDRWEVTVRDIADVDWKLCVESRDAAKTGRVEALREAIDELFREALGAPGFFG